MASRLGNRLREYGRDLPRRVNDVKKGTALAILNELVPNTPVKTGKARSNYVVGINAPSRLVRGSEAVSRTGAVSITEGERTIRGAKPGDAIFISNNLPYIDKLDQGSPTQQPAGFRARAVAAGKAYIQAALKRPRGV